MRAASWKGPDHVQDEKQDSAEPVGSLNGPDRPPKDAIRSWLVKGIHPFAIDPRRLGGHGHARRILGEDTRAGAGTTGGWRELASALQRHTLHNALMHLTPEEREVITLAYLQGRTNRQIAVMLGVSISTVRRRLWNGLEHLDNVVRRTGAWISALLLLGLAYVNGGAVRLGRLVNAAASTDTQNKLVATVVAGVVAGAAVSLVALDLHAPISKHMPPVTAAGSLPDLSSTVKISLAHLGPLNPGTSARSSTAGHPATTDASVAGSRSKRGCHGKPIDAVTSTSDHPEGGVVHLASGGCQR